LAHRIELNWLLFFTADTVILFIAVVAISFQTIKAALANPAKSLRRKNDKIFLYNPYPYSLPDFHTGRAIFMNIF